jgi:hypothetical protein
MHDPKTRPAARLPNCSGPVRWQVLDLSIAASLAAGLASLAAVAWLGASVPDGAEATGLHAHSIQTRRHV